MRDCKLIQANGMWIVKIGGQMPDWKKHDLIMTFRREFQSCEVEETGGGTNISGIATITRTF